MSRGAGRGLNPANAGVHSGDVSCSTRSPFFPSATYVGRRDFHIVHIIQRAVPVERLVDHRLLRPFDVDDDDSLLSAGDVRVCARDVDVARIGDRQRCGDARLHRVGHIDGVQATRVRHECIAELHRDACGLFDLRQRRDDARRQRLVDVDDDQSALGADVQPASRDRDRLRALERVARIERRGAREEVVRRIAVSQRRHIDDDQTFFAIGDVCVRVRSASSSAARRQRLPSSSRKSVVRAAKRARS
jgi:hypothetical protein